MRKDVKMKIRGDEEVGMPAHFYYDPYFYRFQEHVKTLLCEGNPIIARLHPGENYPMPDDILHYRVDREGHVVAIVGYDNNDQTFTLADPWSEEFGGERGGTYKIPYSHLPIELVDATADAATAPVPWDMNIEYPENPDGEFYIKGKVTYTIPAPLSRSYYHMHECHVKINPPEGVKLLDSSIKKMGDSGTFAPGDTIEVEWKAEAVKEKIDGEVTIQARGIVSSSDPYMYDDVIGNKGTARISLIPERVLV